MVYMVIYHTTVMVIMCGKIPEISFFGMVLVCYWVVKKRRGRSKRRCKTNKQ